MRLLIAGASGFFGSALTTLAHERGHTVRHLVRREPHADHEFRWDPAAGQIDTAAFADVDAVVCLSGAGIADRPWTPARQREIIASRISTVYLLARTLAALPRRPEVFVSGSAIGFYGSRGTEPLTEASGAGKGWLPQVCRAWEAASVPAPTRAIQLRTGHLMDDRDGLLGVLAPFYRRHLGALLGDGTQYFSSIWIGDATAAVLWAIEHDLSGPVNLTAPHPVTFRQWHEALQRELGVTSALVAPRPFLAAMGAMGEELLLTSQRVYPAALQAAEFPFQAPTVEEILRRAVHKRR